MNMNDQEWNEIWDEEPDEDDEFNDFGSDVDANNDETFDNAAEWNEDEHEELIARDSILSHTIRNNNNSNSRHANNRTLETTNTVNHTNFVAAATSNNHNIQRASSNKNSANNGNRNTEYCFLGSDNAPTWGLTVDEALFPIQERPKPQNLNEPGPSDMSQVLRNAQRYIQSMSQQEKAPANQNQDFRRLMSQGFEQPNASRSPKMGRPMGERILTVDELEKQLLKTSINPNREQQTRPHPTEISRRAGWSPFGGKELFTAPDEQPYSQLDMASSDIVGQGQIRPSFSLNQQQQIFMQQQQQMLQQQQLLQQMSLMKQQQIQTEQRLMAQNPQCFTVEELERQLLANRSSQNHDAQRNQDQNKSETHESPKTDARIQVTPERQLKNLDRVPILQHNNHRRRDGDRYDRDGRENRHSYRDRRDNARDGHRDHDHRSSGPIIVPPQVQLSVIEKGKHLHPLASTQGDEFLQDRVPTMKDGFLMKRHSIVARSKSNHDGVLTEKERKWLTQIQEKIQADYDDNMDQDYYYLLYFNRTSIPNENAQKSRGPGVLDRRFIPRERLLYDSST